MTKNTSTKSKKLMMMTFLIAGTITFLVADVIAIVILLQRNKPHLQNHPLVLFMPVVLLFPLIGGLVGYKNLRRHVPIADNAPNEVLLDVRLWIAFIAMMSYSALGMSMILVVAAAKGR